MKEQNKKLLESCEGATMMYEDLCKAKNIIIKLLEVLIVIDGEQTREFKEVKEAEQFLNKDKAGTSEEPYYVIMNMNCQYEICRKCPKSGLFKGTYEECENWIKEKLSGVEK